MTSVWSLQLELMCSDGPQQGNGSVDEDGAVAVEMTAVVEVAMFMYTSSKILRQILRYYCALRC